MNSRYYGFSQMRTLTRGPYSIRYKGSYYGIAFPFNAKNFVVLSVNIKYNIYSCEKSQYAQKLDSKAHEII